MSVYKVVELVGTSDASWEQAAKNAIETAGKTLKNLRIAEVLKLDIKIDDGHITYRAKICIVVNIKWIVDIICHCS